VDSDVEKRRDAQLDVRRGILAPRHSVEEQRVQVDQLEGLPRRGGGRIPPLGLEPTQWVPTTGTIYPKQGSVS